MKIEVEIVTGFLGSGKTSFINSLIKESYVDGEKIIVIQFENGKSKIDKELIENKSVIVALINNLTELNNKIKSLIKDNYPNRIIIEFNGTWDIEDLFKIGDEKSYKEHIRLETIYFIGDCKKIELYMRNMSSILVPFIEYSNVLVLNNMEFCDEFKRKKILEELKMLNQTAFILEVKNKYLFDSCLIENRILNKSIFKKIRIKICNSNNILRRKNIEK